MNMKRFLYSIPALCLLFSGSIAAVAQQFNKIPSAWKWLSPTEAAFSYDGDYAGEDDFILTAPAWVVTKGLGNAAGPEDKPAVPEVDGENPTLSPDGGSLAFTRGGDLYVKNLSTGKEIRLTSDGSSTVYNGYASWVYYEEILGRPSHYRAFWWSPDGKKLAFYRFDDSRVPVFPIYSPFGQDGSLRLTRYPKAGEPNPGVKIGFVSLSKPGKVVWADLDSSGDHYFGIPFWGDDSRLFYVQREPRLQNELDLFAVSSDDGSKKLIYHESSPTWVDFMDGMLFDKEGLYMARSTSDDWQQIYYLSYDGLTLRKLTGGTNWNIVLKMVGQDGSVYFTARRDSQVREALYRVTPDGDVIALTDPGYNVSSVSFSPDGRFFIAALSNLETPVKVWAFETARARQAFLAWNRMEQAGPGSKPSRRKTDNLFNLRFGYKVADLKGPGYDPSAFSLSKVVTIVSDGFEIPATIMLPLGFDPSLKYPVHVDIYGGPDSPMVRDRWVQPDERNQWYARNGIIQMVADCRDSGHNGRAGLDAVYRHLADLEVKDFVAWADYLKSLPYVDGGKIGVEGFSFGGTMTAMLLLTASDSYHYGIAGGGVYDWMLYDTHYTERFMSTPSDNPGGYAEFKVLNHVDTYPASVTDPMDGVAPVMLKLTHGTGDDNVHYQQTLQLVDALQKAGKRFEFMVYPDGMHGYRGKQANHFLAENRAFWLKYLKGESSCKPGVSE